MELYLYNIYLHRVIVKKIKKIATKPLVFIIENDDELS